mgnify:FL=1
MKVDKYSQEAELLGKNHIDTSEQLFSYKESVEKEIETLTDERKHLRNKMRHKDISEVELSQIKKEISDISARLKKLRNELNLCNDIAERSHIVEEKVQQIEKDENKQERKYKSKEERLDEQFR